MSTAINAPVTTNTWEERLAQLWLLSNAVGHSIRISETDAAYITRLQEHFAILNGYLAEFQGELAVSNNPLFEQANAFLAEKVDGALQTLASELDTPVHRKYTVLEQLRNIESALKVLQRDASSSGLLQKPIANVHASTQERLIHTLNTASNDLRVYDDQRSYVASDALVVGLTEGAAFHPSTFVEWQQTLFHNHAVAVSRMEPSCMRIIMDGNEKYLLRLHPNIAKEAIGWMRQQ